jgi:hypothetical protein
VKTDAALGELSRKTIKNPKQERIEDLMVNLQRSFFK